MTGVSGGVAAASAHAAASPAAQLQAPTGSLTTVFHLPPCIHDLWIWICAGWPSDYLPPLVALLAFLWSILVFISAKKRERFKLGIDLMMKMGERFESTALREQRTAAAAALLAKRKGDDPALDAVLDFFEEVAYLRRRGAVDVEAVYEYFSYWLELYGRATAGYRAERRVIWDGVQRLVPEVAQFEDWKLSRWRLRWRSRLVHCIAWRMWRSSDTNRNWDSPNSDTDGQLLLEMRVLNATSAESALGWRRVKIPARRQ